MLMDYPDEVTVRIDGLAASAASVIAMAGTRVEMAPTALMMIHNPLTAVLGDYSEMAKAITMLSEVKESIINAYEIKTDLSREELSTMMDEETWMNAYKAIELGFCDGIMSDTLESNQATYAYSTSKQVATCLLNKVKADTTPITALVDRLNQMKP